ncbi:hypothetical protein V5799_007082 [Amblyomma americanum]|uniref:Integrase catalytic domain-containing protein n=1 Tax=Amblyomma americanum TaxID=6943 RepID=A0AAQ4DUJ7_AMBAM
MLSGKAKEKQFPKGRGNTGQGSTGAGAFRCGWKHHTNDQRGSSYFVTFTDDCSRYTAVYSMKAKSEVLQKFDKYRRIAENLHNTKVKTLRSDNGGECKSKELNEYRAEHAIRHHLTIPGTPE